MNASVQDAEDNVVKSMVSHSHRPRVCPQLGGVTTFVRKNHKREAKADNIT
jgi:hypothetical protein